MQCQHIWMGLLPHCLSFPHYLFLQCFDGKEHDDVIYHQIVTLLA